MNVDRKCKAMGREKSYIFCVCVCSDIRNANETPELEMKNKR